MKIINIKHSVYILYKYSPMILHSKILFTTEYSKLDFEMVALYSLVIYAKDDRQATASQTILMQTQDVNELPIFTGSLAQGDQGTELFSWEGRTLWTYVC